MDSPGDRPGVLRRGDPAYTLIQVSVNDLVLILLYAPIVKGLLGLSKIYVPYDTVLLSVVLYVMIPLALGYASRRWLLSRKGEEWFEGVFLRRLRPVTIGGLLLTLVILFSYQGDKIIQNPTHIFLIAIPLAIQTFFIFAIAYGAALATVVGCLKRSPSCSPWCGSRIAPGPGSPGTLPREKGQRDPR